MRCTNFGRKCDGYRGDSEEPQLSKETKEQPAPRRKLLSKAFRGPSCPPPAIQFTLPTLSSIPFHDNREYEYFTIFREQTASELSGGFDPILWNEIVIQSCDNISVRELTAAIAALSIAGKQCSKTKSQPTAFLQRYADYEVNSHHQYALMQYGRALQRIQSMVATGQHTMRIALITALLIFVFESLHGDTERAVTTILSALELILRRLSSFPRQNRVSRVSSHRSQNCLIPIEEDLLSAFIRMDGPPMITLGKEEQGFNYPLRQIFSMAYHTKELSIPSCFASISEARLYLEEIKWGISPNSETDISCYQRSTAHVSKQYRNGTLRFRFESRTFQAWYGTAIKPNRTAKQHFKQWHNAFKPLLEHSTTSSGAATFIPATTLYIQALQDDFSHFPGFIHDSLSSENALLHTARTIISLSRRLIANPRFSHSFTLDQGIIPTIVVLLLACPDRTLKYQARDLLQAMIPRREGVWDSRAVACAAEKMLAHEMAIETAVNSTNWNTVLDGTDVLADQNQMLGVCFSDDTGSTQGNMEFMESELFVNEEFSLFENCEIDPALKGISAKT